MGACKALQRIKMIGRKLDHLTKLPIGENRDLTSHTVEDPVELK
jgi:hypothetical protein